MANMLNKNSRNTCHYGCCRWNQVGNRHYRASEKRVTVRIIREERQERTSQD